MCTMAVDHCNYGGRRLQALEDEAQGCMHAWIPQPRDKNMNLSQWLGGLALDPRPPTAAKSFTLGVYKLKS